MVLEQHTQTYPSPLNTGVVPTSPQHFILYGSEFHAIVPSMQYQGLDSLRLSAPGPSF